MKIRTDFVTNSSSSSFIFGKPGTEDLTVEMVIAYIKGIAKDIIDIFDYIDKVIKEEVNLKHELDSYRKENKSYYPDGDKLNDKITKNRNIRDKIKSIMRDKGITDYLTFGDIMYEYLGGWSTEKLRKIANDKSNSTLPIKSHIVDIREADKNEIEEILYWYMDEEDVTEDFKDPNQEAFKRFGQIALIGESGYLPYLLAQFLINKLDYGCDHMG